MPSTKPRKGRTVVAPQRGEPWELPELDHAKRDDSILALAQAAYDTGLHPLANDYWSAAYFWWTEVLGGPDCPGGADPLKIAMYAFGATREQCEDTDTPFGLAMSRILVALDVKRDRKTARVEDALYTGAIDPSNTAAQKLYLQAHKPEYVPTTKSKVTIDDVAALLAETGDDELKRID